MGNSGGKAKEPSVKKRKKQTGKRKDRPLSDPVGVSARPGGPEPGPDLWRAGSEDLTGRRYEDGAVSFSPNPIFQDGSGEQATTPETPPALPGTSALANDAIMGMYKKGLQLVLGVWPELSGLNDLNTKKLKPAAVDALQSLFKNSYDETQESEALRQEKQKLKDYVGGLENRVQRQDDELHRKQNTIDGLDHEVQILTGELRRRGIEPRLLERGSRKVPKEPPSDYDTLPIDDAPSTVKEAKMTPQEIEEEDPYSTGKKKGMFVATPLLQAEGVRGLGSAILSRSQSLRQTGSGAVQGGTAVDPARAPDMSKVVENLNQKLRSMQHALEDERRRRLSIEERLEGLDNKGGMSTYVSGPGPTPDTLRIKYDDLEGQALSRVVTSLYRILSHVTHADVTRFLCSTMQLSFDHAAEQYQHFLGSLHALLMSPSDSNQSGNELSNSQNKKHPGQLPRFNQEKKGSRLAKRTLANHDLPNNLEEEVRDFVRVTSDITNVDQILETVANSLRERWPNCATTGVLNHASYSDFLHECCLLAWQLNTTSPPCYVTADPSVRFDERYHTVLPVQADRKPTIGAQIDYFAWPMLYRKRHGEILYKGRVALATSL